MDASSITTMRETRTVIPKLGLVSLCVLALTSGAVSREANTLPSPALKLIQLMTEEKKERVPSRHKMACQLVHEMLLRRDEDFARELPRLRTGVQVDARGYTVVDVQARITPDLLREIEDMGGTILHSSQRFYRTRCVVPLERIEALAGYPGVRFIEVATPFSLDKVDTSEGDAAHGVEETRKDFRVGCVAATNTNGDDAADVSDAVHSLGYLFLGGAPPAGPFPDCGIGSPVSDEELTCLTPPESCQ